MKVWGFWWKSNKLSGLKLLLSWLGYWSVLHRSILYKAKKIANINLRPNLDIIMMNLTFLAILLLAAQDVYGRNIIFCYWIHYIICIYFDKSNEYYFYYLKVVVRATNGAAKDNVVKEKETAMKIVTAYQDWNAILMDGSEPIIVLQVFYSLFYYFLCF